MLNLLYPSRCSSGCFTLLLGDSSKNICYNMTTHQPDSDEYYIDKTGVFDQPKRTHRKIFESLKELRKGVKKTWEMMKKQRK